MVIEASTIDLDCVVISEVFELIQHVCQWWLARCCGQRPGECASSLWPLAVAVVVEQQTGISVASPRSRRLLLPYRLASYPLAIALVSAREVESLA